jgi:cyclopropane-fatty-acyl-phospholipid synthase
VGATSDEIQVSYDRGNDFFRLWLDARMNYTSALFSDAKGADESLEDAQVRKLAFLHDAARIEPSHRVLDIGCGWGANLEYLAVDRGVKEGHGLTLSPAQVEEVRRRKLPGVTVDCVSYADYRSETPFDAVVSIGMLEHVVSPEQARSGKAIDTYRNYFRLAHGFTRPGAYFGLQTIVRDRIPRVSEDVRDLAWVTRTIFPGSLAPRLEDVVVAVAPYWEVREVHARRDDYRRTSEHWRSRLRAHEQTVRARFGDESFDLYDRYLGICVRNFEAGYLSLCRFSLRRRDEQKARA